MNLPVDKYRRVTASIYIYIYTYPPLATTADVATITVAVTATIAATIAAAMCTVRPDNIFLRMFLAATG